MKRILLLALCLALAAAGTAFAQLTYSGQFQYGAISNFDDAPGLAWDNKLVFTAKIDDFNTAVMRIRMRDGNTSTNLNDPSATAWSSKFLLSSDAPFIDRAYLTTDVTKALGFKGILSDSLTAGFTWVTTADLTDGISPFEVADLDSDGYFYTVGFGGGKQPVFSNVATIAEKLNLRFAIAPNDFSTGSGGWFISADVAMPAGPGTLTPEAVFSVINGASADKGALVFAAKYDMAAGKDMTVAVVPQYMMLLDSDSTASYQYAVAGKVTVGSLAAISAGFLGYDGSEANRMEARLVLTPVKAVGFDIGAVFNLDKDVYATAAGDSNVLNDLDISAFVTVGAATVRFGYLFLGEEGFASQINNDLVRIGYGGSCLKQGGLYLETTIAF